MDAITLLRNDHRTVEQLFKRFEKAGDGALVAKREIVDRIIEELSVHAAIEEQLFYPAARATVPGVEDIALESLEEHHIVKWVLSELDGLAPADERFDAKVTVLIENVRHHVEEEQNEFFPKVRDELGRKALNELGDAMVAAKASAPTHPHPRAPDTPPGNTVIGNVSGVVDRIGDNLSGLAQGTVSATQDLIARLTSSKKPKTSPTGNSVARKRAQSTRAASDQAADAVASTARRADQGDERHHARRHLRSQVGGQHRGSELPRHGDHRQALGQGHRGERQAGREDDHRRRQARRVDHRVDGEGIGQGNEVHGQAWRQEDGDRGAHRARLMTTDPASDSTRDADVANGENPDDATSQPAPAATDHPTGEDQAKENTENDPPA